MDATAERSDDFTQHGNKLHCHVDHRIAAWTSDNAPKDVGKAVQIGAICRHLHLLYCALAKLMLKTTLTQGTHPKPRELTCL